MEAERTIITDVDIPFGRLVLIILKIMLASIPAVILFYLILALIMMPIVAVTGGMGHMMAN